MLKKFPQTLVLATTNTRKISEIQHLLKKPDYHLQLQSDFGVTEIEETGLTFVENAIIKARHAAKHTLLPVLADDSGIVIDALEGRPGIYSARYAGKNASSSENIFRILEEMKSIPWQERTARFYGVLVYLQSELDPMPRIFEGIWNGYILFEPTNDHGFGYDPVFYVPSHDCSAAELAIEEKNKLSHRGQALLKMQEYFSNFA